MEQSIGDFFFMYIAFLFYRYNILWIKSMGNIDNLTCTFVIIICLKC